MNPIERNRFVSGVMSLREFQRAFCRALESGDMTGLPEGISSDSFRFFLHHHTCRQSLLDRLSTVFEKTRQVIGSDHFVARAIAYMDTHPQTTPYLLLYGEDFGSFLRQSISEPMTIALIQFEEAIQKLLKEPLPDVTHDREHWATFSEFQLERLRFRFHPHVRLYQTDFPLHIFWDTIPSPDESLRMRESWSYMMQGTVMGVTFKPMGKGDVAFLSTLFDNDSLGEAQARALSIESNFDLSQALARCLPYVKEVCS